MEANPMTLTQDQIEGIEGLVDRLKKWQSGEMPGTIGSYSRYTQLLRFVEPQANVVLMGLSTTAPELMRSIQVRLQELLRKASLVDRLKQKDVREFRLEDSSLMRQARDFALTLMRVARGVEGENVTLGNVEQGIIKALAEKTLTGGELARATGQPYSFQFKSSLAELRKRGILGNKSPGYFLEPEYEFLLDK